MELAFECRICKKATPHKIVIITDKMPSNVHVLECLSCGVLGVKSMSDQMVK